MLRISLAVLHLLALGIGMGAIFARARGANRLRQSPDALRDVFAADSWWGAAAGLWVVTGLWRAIAGTEKASGYYWSNHVFYAKMGLFVLILALEIWPMVTLLRWRMAPKASVDAAPLARKGHLIARISDVQLLLLVGMLIAAVMMARGYGAR